VVESKVVESKVVESKVVESKVVESKVVESKVVESKVVESQSPGSWVGLLPLRSGIEAARRNSRKLNTTAS